MRSEISRGKTLVIIMMFVFVLTVVSCNEKPASEKVDHTPPAAEVAQEVPRTVEEIALYEGADREQMLLEGAKKEGTLSVYTSVPLEDMQKIADGFKQKYDIGIDVEIWRASSTNVLQKIVEEARGEKHAFDIVSMNSVNTDALSAENLLQKVKSPHVLKLNEKVIPDHQEWMPLYYNIFVNAYNTNSVKEEELPRTYEDLLDPRWKDRLAIEAANFDWFASVVKQMGEEKGIQYFKDLVQITNLSTRTGNSVLAELVAAGEVPYALTVYSYKTRQLKADGAPLEWYAIEPAFARSTAVAVAKHAPHPYSAVLFFDYLLSEGQQILADMHYDPANRDYELQDKLNIEFMDDEAINRERDKWFTLFEDIIIKKIR